MHEKIIVQSDEQIVCPKCSNEFALADGITRQTIDRHGEEFESMLRQGREELEAHLAREAERKATQLAAEQIAHMQELVSKAKRAERSAQESLDKARKEGRESLAAEVELERKAMQEDLVRKDEQLSTFRGQEIELRRQRQALEDQQRNLEVDLHRRLDEERGKIASAASRHEAERFSLLEAEYRKKIEDAQRANEDLRRKLDQGSQQLKGEVLELEVERSLATTFFHDLIEEVKKGARGADVVQTVRTPSGAIAGKIIWEAKRAESWSDKWVQKLKDDQQEAKADLAVIVTTAMPNGTDAPFTRVGDVWVITPQVLRPMAETLRVILLETHKLRQVNTGKAEKMELLYGYLTSQTFAQRVRTMLDSFRAMQQDLDAEKRAITKLWAKRQTQIDRVSNSMVTVVGELQGLAHDSMPSLDSIEALMLPA